MKTTTLVILAKSILKKLFDRKIAHVKMGGGAQFT
jgi:hypothetical protein